MTNDDPVKRGDRIDIEVNGVEYNLAVKEIEKMIERAFRWLLYAVIVGVPIVCVVPIAYAVDGRQGLRNVRREFWRHAPTGTGQ